MELLAEALPIILYFLGIVLLVILIVLAIKLISTVDKTNRILDNVEENSRSLVLWFSLGGKKFLLMGDAPVEIEENIMSEYKDLDCDYLKVGHHGSDTSSSLEFLKYVSPKEAIISCGVDNMYGHPSDKVLQNLNTLKIKVRRTDLEGTIEYLL